MATIRTPITGAQPGGDAADAPAHKPRAAICAPAALLAALFVVGGAQGAPLANPGAGAAIVADGSTHATPTIDTDAVELVGPVAHPGAGGTDNGAADSNGALSDTEARPLGAARSRANAPRANGASAPLSENWIVRTCGALGVVVGLILLLRAAARRVALRSGGVGGQLSAGGRAPSGVLYVLGRYPVSRGQTLVLLQIDRRVLLLNQTPQGFTTLAEITDPDEVASILVRTRDEEGASMAERFRTLLRGMERDPSIAGGFDEPAERWPRGRDPIGSVRRRLASMREGA